MSYYPRLSLPAAGPEPGKSSSLLNPSSITQGGRSEPSGEVLRGLNHTWDR